MPNKSGLILDTHVWVWLNSGNSELSAASIAKIESAAIKGQVGIPAISVWEIATLVAKGRLKLLLPTHQWVYEALSKRGIDLVPLEPDIAIESTELPGDFHGDPADRLIVATARVRGLPLLTRDAKILAYGDQGHVVTVRA
jgi:PIN domain nuclease of toxin-antitoxin system